MRTQTQTCETKPLRERSNKDSVTRTKNLGMNQQENHAKTTKQKRKKPTQDAPIHRVVGTRETTKATRTDREKNATKEEEDTCREKEVVFIDLGAIKFSSARVDYDPARTAVARSQHAGRLRYKNSFFFTGIARSCLRLATRSRFSTPSLCCSSS